MTTREKLAVLGIITGAVSLAAAAIIFYDAHKEATPKAPLGPKILPIDSEQARWYAERGGFGTIDQGV